MAPKIDFVPHELRTSNRCQPQHTQRRVSRSPVNRIARKQNPQPIDYPPADKSKKLHAIADDERRAKPTTKVIGSAVSKARDYMAQAGKQVFGAVRRYSQSSPRETVRGTDTQCVAQLPDQ